MAVSFGCRCGERKKPVEKRNWCVTQRYCNHSAFHGGRYTPSDYSEVYCRVCGAIGRTRAKYVDQLKDCKRDIT